MKQAVEETKEGCTTLRTMESLVNELDTTLNRVNAERREFKQ